MSIPTHLPGVAYAAAPRAAGPASVLSLPPRLVVIHDTSNTASAANEAHYAATRTDAQSGWTSAHFYVDTSGPLGSLPLNKQAWAAYSYANSHGWHIEMCGTNAGTPTAVPAVTVAKTATLVRTLCQLGGIPMVKLSPADVAAGKRGICGHRDITQGLHVGTHDDPGPAFDWAAFINQVKSGDDDDMTQDDFNALMTGFLKSPSAYWFGQMLRDTSLYASDDRAGTVGQLLKALRVVLGGTGSDSGDDAAWTLADAKAALAGLGSSSGGAGGLTDADRAAVAKLTDAVNELNSRLATP